MKKPLKPEVKVDGVTRLISVTAEDGAYCVTEFEMPTADLVKYAKRISRSEPDIFAVLIMNLTKKAREILGI